MLHSQMFSCMIEKRYCLEHLEEILTICKKGTSVQGEQLATEMLCCAYSLSHVWLFLTPWSVAHQAALSMGFSNTGVGCHPLLQGIFPTEELNPGFSHCRQILYHLSHQGSPRTLEWVDCPFSRGSSQPRNWNRGLLHCRWILYQLNYQLWTTSWYNCLVMQCREEPNNAHSTNSIYSILLSLGHHTVYHRLSSLTNSHLFFTVLKAGSPRRRCWPVRFLVRNLFLACVGLCLPSQGFLSVCVCRAGRHKWPLYL